MAAELPGKGLDRTLGKAAAALEKGLRAERPDEGQQEAQRRAALAAGEDELMGGDGADRLDAYAPVGNVDRRAERGKTREHGPEILRKRTAGDLAGLRAEGGAVKQALRRGFGGGSAHRAAPFPAGEKDRHGAPPSRSQASSSARGTSRSSQRPISRGTTRQSASERRFLSCKTASSSSSAG